MSPSLITEVPLCHPHSSLDSPVLPSINKQHTHPSPHILHSPPFLTHPPLSSDPSLTCYACILPKCHLSHSSVVHYPLIVYQAYVLEGEEGGREGGKEGGGREEGGRREGGGREEGVGKELNNSILHTAGLCCTNQPCSTTTPFTSHAKR